MAAECDLRLSGSGGCNSLYALPTLLLKTTWYCPGLFRMFKSAAQFFDFGGVRPVPVFQCKTQPGNAIADTRRIIFANILMSSQFFWSAIVKVKNIASKQGKCAHLPCLLFSG